MLDTTDKIQEIYINMLRQKTEEQRALMGFAMFDTARTLAKASLEEARPLELKLAIFNRFYGNDFNEDVKEKILKHLTAVS